MKVPITPVYFRIPLNVTKILNESESTTTPLSPTLITNAT